MAWDVQLRHGVWLPQIEWWLDAHYPVERSFVSHAHSDHTATHREILCSAGTAALMRARLPAERIEHILPFGQTEQLTPDCTVTLHPAGHIFGSAQALLEHAAHGSLLYTGDFKLRRGLSAEPCASPHADVLIMETTFGRPQYVFPPTEQVLREITHFCHETLADGDTPILFGYSLGKSQEVLRGLTAANLPVMLHPQTSRLTKIYESFGIVFPAYREFDPAALAGQVVICPPQSRESSFVRKIPRRRTAIITGWAIDPGAIHRYQCDAAFPLSDHADFPDLLRFVDAVQPKRVLTLHGFAREFAQTLRERGIEAWAIGQDNQMEFTIGPAPAPPAIALHPPPRAAADVTGPAPAPAAFARFVAVADIVKATPKKLEKVAALQAYLSTLKADDAAIAATFFTGRAFPQSDPRTLTLGWAVIKRAVLDASGLNEADFRAAYRRFADAGDAAAAVLAQGLASKLSSTSQPPASGAEHRATLADLARFFAQISAARSAVAKLEQLRERLSTASPNEARYLVKIITGDLRVGLKEGLLEEAVAAASGQPVEAIREANMLCGDIAKVTLAARRGELDAIQLEVFHPLQFMLASPVPNAAALLERLSPPGIAAPATPLQPADDTVQPANEHSHPAEIWLEEKYDGIRCQMHKRGARVELYSRDLNRITGQFPDLVRAAAHLPGDFIADGELLAWRDGRALPFAELQKRLGRTGGDDFFLGAEIPVSISFYDLLWRDGRSLLKEPLITRRDFLTQLLDRPRSAPAAPFTLAPVQRASSTQEIEAAFLAARRRGNEGLMAKDPHSLYTPGRRGLAWLKLKKAYATLDVVVVAVEYGHGKRRDVLSDYTFAIRDTATDRLLTIGKAYSGLTDVEIAALTQHFLDQTIALKGHLRQVVPDTVIEVAFDTIQPSRRHESGFALRFPRIARLRPDKTPADIDTLDTCRQLAVAAAFGGADDAGSGGTAAPPEASPT